MTRSTMIRALIVAATGTLLLAGCSTGSSATATTPGSTTTTAPAVEGDAQPTGAGDEPVAPTDVVAAEDLPNEPVGSKITVAGAPATVCLYGDDRGTSVWAGGEGTSCDFVEAAHDAMTAGQDESVVLHDQLITEITVADPASGDDVVMACGSRGKVLTTCVSADGRTVHLY
jgi:hypothetical protein